MRVYVADLEPIGVMYDQSKKENSASATMGRLLLWLTLQGSTATDA
jgi:hypothetical protein